jgi:AraC-like DNA-binding protein
MPIEDLRVRGIHGTVTACIALPAGLGRSETLYAQGVFDSVPTAAGFCRLWEMPPGFSSRAFRLDNAVWEYPSFDNAEVLVARLARAGLLVRDAAVSAALAGDWQAMTRRSAQRHFRLATGLTHRTYRQVERARYAAGLLRDGAGIGETVHLAGYYDQAHLTRSLKRLIGQTPARIRRHEGQLSLLYKTSPQG